MAHPYSYSVAELLNLRDTVPAVTWQFENMDPAASSGRISVSEDVRRRVTTSSTDSSHGIKKHDSAESSSLRLSTSQLGSEFLQSATSPDEVNDGDGGGLVYGSHPAYHNLQKAWKLQRRRFADRSSQPFPAPTGTEAQKADNFKMFYEAVVSPSHVRVTAGGRIVPNIRGTPHSATHWNSENGCFEDLPPSSMEPQAQWLQGISTLCDEPYSPLNVAPAGGHTFFGPPLPSSGLVAGQTMPSLTSEQKHGVSSKGFPDGSHESGTQNEVKISPPSQFDTSRPFMYNGQLVYPVPPDFQIPAQIPGLPVNMLGNPNIAHQPFIHQHGHVGQPPLQFAQPMIPSGSYLPQHGAMMSLPGFHHLGMPMQLGPINQVAPNFLVMPQTNMQEQPVPFAQGPAGVFNQLQGLEQQLERLERQLRKCKDQTEKQHVMTKQVNIQSQIIGLQKILGTQMTHPGSSVEEQPGFRASPWPVGVGMMGAPAAQTPNIAPSSVQMQTPENKSVLSAADAGSAIVKTPPEKIGRSVKTDSSSSGGVGTKVVYPDPLQLSSRKLLEAAAAMAAPFQPRSQQPATDLVPSLKNKPKIENIAQGYKDPTGFTKTTRQTGPTTSSTTGKWTNSEAAVSAAAPGFTALPKPQTMYSPASGNDLYSPPINLQSFSSFPITSSVPFEHPTTYVPMKRPAEPYLCGYVPFGMSSSTAKSVHMVYRRELTEEERRARELYWGKAPPELSRGLPKFDGKDFYPPSPVKEPGRQKMDRTQQNQNFNHSLNIPSSFAQRVSAKSEQINGGSRSDFRTDNLLDLKLNNTNEAKFISKSESSARIAEPKIGDDISSTHSWGPLGTATVEASLPLANKSSRSKGKELVQDGTGSISYSASPFKSIGHQQTHPTFQQRILRSSPHTAMGVATDGLSSATARGYLTQYTGSAAASLAPSINNVSASFQVYRKTDNAVLPGPIASARVENRPLSRLDGEREPLSAADLLRKVKRQVKEVSDAGFNSNTTGIGPVYDGEDW